MPAPEGKRPPAAGKGRPESLPKRGPKLSGVVPMWYLYLQDVSPPSG
jgi:hypothetical protein